MINIGMFKNRRFLVSIIVGIITTAAIAWYVNTYIYNFFAATERITVGVKPSVTSIKSNSEFTVGVSAANQQIDAVDIYLSYDPKKVEYLNKYTQLPQEYFSSVVASEVVTVGDKKQIHLAMVSVSNVRQKSILINFQFKSLGVPGDAAFTLESKSQVTGVDGVSNPITFDKDPALPSGKITINTTAPSTIPSVVVTIKPTTTPTVPSSSTSQWVLTLKAVCSDPKAVLSPTFKPSWYLFNNGTGPAARSSTGTAQPVIVNGPTDGTYSIQLLGPNSLVPLTVPAGMTKGANNVVTWSSATLKGSTQTITFTAPATACTTITPTLPYQCGNADCSNKMYKVSPPILTSNAQQICVAKGWGVCAVCNVGYGPVSIHGWKPDTGSWSSSCPGGTLGGFNPTNMEVCCTIPSPTKVPTKVPPVISSLTWKPTTPVSGDPVEGTISGTDTDSTKVTIKIMVSGQNIPETLFATGEATVTAGKWSYKVTKNLPGFVGKFKVYAIVQDEANIVKSTIYEVSVLAPTPKDTCPLKLKGDANCDSKVNLLDAVCLRGELIGKKPLNCTSADFNNDKKVSISDAPIWRSTYIKENAIKK